MKKILFPILLLATLFITTSCGNDDDYELKIWDFAPTTVSVYVQNANGQDLLDSQTPGNILDDAITLTYNGQTTGLNSNPFYEQWNDGEAQVASRFYPATWRGVFISQDKNGHNFLCIGEWQTEQNFNDDFLLAIGNHNYAMNLDHTFKFTDKKHSDCKITTTLKVNGQEVDANNSTTVTATITL